MRAAPGRLEAFAEVADQMVTDLRADQGSLADALDGLRASAGWTEFLADVPPLDIDVGAGSGRLELLGRLTSSIAARLRRIDADGEVVEGLGAVFWLLVRADILRFGIGDGPALVHDGERWIVIGTDRADHVEVIERDGRLVVIVSVFDGERFVEARSFTLTDEQADALTIRTGRGNDVIAIHPAVDVEMVLWTGDGDDLIGWGGDNPAVRISGGNGLTIFTGDGDDIIHGSRGDDRIYTGAGRDVVDAGDGDDLVVAGGVAGDVNVVYGGRGADTLIGGAGDDYLEGGRGRDTLHGMAGSNVLSGGRGSDTIHAGSGDDVIVGGRGRDTILGTSERDTVHHDGRDQVEGGARRIRVEVEGSPGSTAIHAPRPAWMSDAEYRAWLDRIDTDLELLRHLRDGQDGLHALDAASEAGDRRIVLLPYVAVEGGEVVPDGWSETDWARRGSRSLGGNFATGSVSGLDGDALVNYGDRHSAISTGDRPPVVSLYHELSHSFDQIQGGTEQGSYVEVFFDADGNEIGRNTIGRRSEINAVGYDDGQGGPITTRPNAAGVDHPAALTENALRDALGWERRHGYGVAPRGTESSTVILVDEHGDEVTA